MSFLSEPVDLRPLGTIGQGELRMGSNLAGEVSAAQQIVWPDVQVIEHTPRGVVIKACNTNPNYELLPSTYRFQSSDANLVEIAYMPRGHPQIIGWTRRGDLANIAENMPVAWVRSLWPVDTFDVLVRRKRTIFYNPEPPMAPGEDENESPSFDATGGTPPAPA